MTDLATATMLAALILVASIVSVEFGISVAIIEIGLGVVGGSLFGLRTTPCTPRHRDDPEGSGER